MLKSIAKPIALVLLCCLPLGLLEVGLRLSDVGDSGALFLSAEGDPNFLLPNPDFASIYFPPGQTRTLKESYLRANKSDATYRIFVLGASAAVGFPDSRSSFSRKLEVMLRQSFEGLEIEVTNLGTAAINSHVVYDIAKHAVGFEPDLFLVYLGNNEVVGPFGPAAQARLSLENVSLIRAVAAIERLRIAQLAADLASTGAGSQWGGMPALVDHPISASDPRLQRVYANFRSNLEGIRDLAVASGARIVFSSVVSNLEDFAPFASAHAEDLAPRDLERWNAFYEKGRRRLEARDPEGALAELEAAREIDAGHAELRFRLARAYSRTGDRTRAATELTAARDLDVLRFRADSTLNRIIEDVAGAEPTGRVDFIDPVRSVSDQLPGFDLFLEHVHFSSRGNHWLAGEFFERVQDIISEDTGRLASPMTLTPEQVSLAILEVPPVRAPLLARLMKMVSQSPFSSREQNKQLIRSLDARIDRLARTPFSLAGPAMEVLRRGPDDLVNHQIARDLLQRDLERVAVSGDREERASLVSLAGAFLKIRGSNEDLNQRREQWSRELRELMRGETTASGEARVERVVLVSIDTLRADRVGCYGAPSAHTPAIDAVAADGVWFQSAIAPTPITLPSHASLLTGLEPPRHGVRDNALFRLPDDVPTLAEQFRDAGFATAAFVGAVVLDRQHGLDRGFEVYDDRMPTGRAVPFGGYSERTADLVVDAALAWLDEAPAKFLLWVHLYDPHANYDPPPDFAAAFRNDPYAGEIAFADAQLARLLSAVDRRFPDGGTLVVVTSDHGESLGEHDEPSHALTLYDATQRVPLVMRGPGIPAIGRVDALAALVDVTPTILGLAGLEPLPSVQGFDLRTAFEGGDADRLVYLETLATRIGFGWSATLGLRSSDTKYLRAPRPELYDLDADPEEVANLLRAPADQAPRVALLEDELEKRLQGARVSLRFEGPGDEERARLEALGYVVGTADAEAAELQRVGGVDPKDGIRILEPLLRAMTLLSERKYEQASATLAPLEHGGPVVEVARARAAIGQGQLERAEQHAHTALALAPRRVAGHIALADALLAGGRLGKARRSYERALELDETDARAMIGLGLVAEAWSQSDRAEQWYRRAVARRGGSGQASWRLAALLIERGDAAGAEAALADVPSFELELPSAVRRLERARQRAP